VQRTRLLTVERKSFAYAAPDGLPLQVVHNGCGEIADAVMTCSGCGERLTPRDMRAVPGPGDLDHLMQVAGTQEERARSGFHPRKARRYANDWWRQKRLARRANALGRSWMGETL
jgi:hypothetical protein